MHHYYKNIRETLESEHLNCFFEENNLLDQFAVKTVKGNSLSVGHLPKEISCVTKFFIDRGADLSVQLTSIHYD